MDDAVDAEFANRDAAAAQRLRERLGGGSQVVDLAGDQGGGRHVVQRPFRGRERTGVAQIGADSGDPAGMGDGVESHLGRQAGQRRRDGRVGFGDARVVEAVGTQERGGGWGALGALDHGGAEGEACARAGSARRGDADDTEGFPGGREPGPGAARVMPGMPIGRRAVPDAGDDDPGLGGEGQCQGVRFAPVEAPAGEAAAVEPQKAGQRIGHPSGSVEAEGDGLAAGPGQVEMAGVDIGGRQPSGLGAEEVLGGPPRVEAEPPAQERGQRGGGRGRAGRSRRVHVTLHHRWLSPV